MIEATNELYKSCKGTIIKACKDAWSRNPLIDYDDYFSYAEEVFMDAVRSYNPASGAKFNTWLTTQLLRLKKYASRGGMMIVDHSGSPDSLLLSLDKRSTDSNGVKMQLHEKGQPYNTTYLKEMSVPNWDHDWWTRMGNLKPYMGELSDDARTMVDDILDGNCSKTDKDGQPQPERGTRNYIKLSPRQLYLRLYRRRGWPYERVRDARIEVEEMLRKWSPCKLPEPEDEVKLCTMSARLVRGGAVAAKSSVTYDRLATEVKASTPEAVEEFHVQDELF